MNRISATAMLLAVTVVSAAAAPRVALVRVKDIYTGLVSTAALQDEIKQDRAAIMKDQRAEELRRIINELQALQTRLSDKNNPLDEATNQKLARSYEIKRQEAQTLQREFEIYRTDQEKQINRKMVTGMRASLNKITETAMKVGRERGYDMVFDESGNTNTSVPFVLYHKKSPDLTDNVKAALADAGEPSAPVGEPAPPTGTTAAPPPASAPPNP
jgi:Skp family chaperone for outer membrane proteins